MRAVELETKPHCSNCLYSEICIVWSNIRKSQLITVIGNGTNLQDVLELIAQNCFYFRDEITKQTIKESLNV